MKIDEIVKQSRTKLDVEEPPIELWENISKEWKSEEKKSTLSIWKVAASFLLITSLGLLIYTQTLHQEIEQLASLGDISPQYESMEAQFETEIESLESSIPLTQVNESNDYSWLMEELATLEKINHQYRADIGTLGNEEQLVKVLVDYYEKKIKLLKKLELEINRSQKADQLKKRSEQNT